MKAKFDRVNQHFYYIKLNECIQKNVLVASTLRVKFSTGLHKNTVNGCGISSQCSSLFRLCFVELSAAQSSFVLLNDRSDHRSLQLHLRSINNQNTAI